MNTYSNSFQHRNPDDTGMEYESAHQPLPVTPVLIQFCLNLLSRAGNYSHGETLYVCVLFQPLPLQLFWQWAAHQTNILSNLTVAQNHAIQ